MRESFPLLLIFDVGCVKISLINIVIFGTDVKFVCFIFRKLHRIHSDLSLFSLLACLDLIKQIEADLWVTKLTKMPLAYLTIIRNRYDIMSIFSTDNSQGMNGMTMTIFGQGRFLNRCSFGSDIPLDDEA